MLGVSISPPHGSMAEKPTSSSTMYSTFGAPSGATGCRYGSQSGVESRMSTLITPSKRLPIVSPLSSAAGVGRGLQLPHRDPVPVAGAADDSLLEPVGPVLADKHEDDLVGRELPQPVVGGLQRVV